MSLTKYSFRNIILRVMHSLSKKHFFWIGATMVLLCAVMPHAETLGFGLVWDDHELVAQMNRTLSGDGIAALITRHFIDEEAGYFRPIVYLSLWLDLVI